MTQQDTSVVSETSSEVTAPTATATAPSPRRQVVAGKGNWWWGTGRRKTAVARVRIRTGEGKFLVNDREMAVFFNEERDRNNINNVLQKTSTLGKVDIHVNVRGGGFMGQAGAIVLGLARALRRYDQTLEPILRENNFLTRDSRKVERKKYGQAGARRRFQFSKR
jgi:small subunit ribosomal protein S9